MHKFVCSMTLAKGLVQHSEFSSILEADLPLVPGTIAGDYSHPTLHVDQYGRITSIVSGTAGGVSIGNAVGGSLTGAFGSNLLMTDNTGHLAQTSANAYLQWYESSPGVGYLNVGNGFSMGMDGGLVCSPQTPTTTGLFVFAALGQSVDLAQWDDNPGNLLSRINKDGYFMTAKVAAPADGDLHNSEVAWWLDATAGTPIVKFKGKDSAGTPFTSSVLSAATAAANAKLLGSGELGAGAPYSELKLGTNLSMAGTTLNATGGADPITSIYPAFTPTDIDDEFDT